LNISGAGEKWLVNMLFLYAARVTVDDATVGQCVLIRK
jgi:hypothetical protein